MPFVVGLRQSDTTNRVLQVINKVYYTTGYGLDGQFYINARHIKCGQPDLEMEKDAHGDIV